MKRYLPACVLLLSFSAHGALHKWVDADGNVHYSDEAPPANVKTQRLKVQSAPTAATSSSGESATKTVAEREAEYRKAQKAIADSLLNATQGTTALVQKLGKDYAVGPGRLRDMWGRGA